MTEREADPERGAEQDEAESLGGLEGAQRVARLVARELGAEAARAIARAWQAQDEHEERRRPDEGLRERKKRQTRQRISDIATTLFIARGFDAVRVAEIAMAVGVSEKTIYNYFPTKESLVFDQTDAQLDGLAAALRDRGPGVSPPAALLGALRKEAVELGVAIHGERFEILIAFGKMVRNTPALRAAWEEHRHRLVDRVVAILAEEIGADASDPEPVIAGQALVGLVDLFYTAQLRAAAERGTLQRPKVIIEHLERAARLLEEGLWGPWTGAGRAG